VYSIGHTRRRTADHLSGFDLPADPAVWGAIGTIGRVRDRQVGGDVDALGTAFSRGEADLKEVYDAHGALIYAICRKALGDLAAAEVTQDVFVSAWKGREQYDPSRGSLSAWLVGIAKRRIVDHVRRERRHSDRRADALDDPAAPEQADVERVADRLTVGHALAGLSERPREVITLAYVHGLTHQEIAARTGLPLGTIKSDIRRGLITLRNHLESIHE
jgi:RNA polymerase sigma-70 factor (ECF subfamily)